MSARQLNSIWRLQVLTIKKSEEIAMLCDVCNAKIIGSDATRITAERFRKMLVKGFGIDETNIRMLTETGISREAAIDMLTYHYSTMQSDWLLCPSCSAKAQGLFGVEEG